MKDTVKIVNASMYGTIGSKRFKRRRVHVIGRITGISRRKLINKMKFADNIWGSMPVTEDDAS